MTALSGHDVKIGIALPSFIFENGEKVSLEYLTDLSRRIEKAGLDSIWVIDHLLVARPVYRVTWYDPLTVLAALMPVTRKVKLGTSILVLPLRNPVIVAKVASSIDAFSGGRLILGVGIGWWDKEFQACGIPKKERAPRLEEGIKVMRKLWSGDAVSFEGRFYKFNDISIEPKPLQNPLPVWISGGRCVGQAEVWEGPDRARPDPVLRRIGRMADGWISRGTATIDQIHDDWKLVTKYAREAGRSPSDIEFAHMNFICLSSQARLQEKAKREFSRFSNFPFEEISSQYFVGTPDGITERMQRLIEIGVQHFVLQLVSLDLESFDVLVDEIVPTITKK